MNDQFEYHQKFKYNQEERLSKEGNRKKKKRERGNEMVTFGESPCGKKDGFVRIKIANSRRNPGWETTCYRLSI